MVCPAPGSRAVRKPVIHSEDLATGLVWIDVRGYGLDDAGEFVPGDRARSMRQNRGREGRWGY